MNREHLAHVLRSAACIVGDEEIVVIGSQAILASFSETDLPAEAVWSVEADVAFRDDPDESKADQVDGAIGELSEFHSTFGYYGQGVSLLNGSTARRLGGPRHRLRQAGRGTEPGGLYRGSRPCRVETGCRPREGH